MEQDPGVGLPSSEGPELELSMKTASHQKPPRNPRRSILGALIGRVMVTALAGILNLTVAGGLVFAAFGAVTRPDLPTPDMLKDMYLQEPLRVYTTDGGLMAEYGIERRRPVSFGAIPPLMVRAFVATRMPDSSSARVSISGVLHGR